MGEDEKLLLHAEFPGADRIDFGLTIRGLSSEQLLVIAAHLHELAIAGIRTRQTKDAIKQSVNRIQVAKRLPKRH